MRNPLAGSGIRRYTRQHLVHDRDAARAEVLRLEGELRTADAAVRELDGQVAQLKADAVDVSVERQLRKAAEERVAALTARLRIFEARDVDPDEQAPEPGGIDVHTLREVFNPAA